MKDRKCNPLFSVLNDQLFVSCFGEEGKSAFAIAQEKWVEYLKWGNLSTEPSRSVTYENFVIATLDERGEAFLYAEPLEDWEGTTRNYK